MMTITQPTVLPELVDLMTDQVPVMFKINSIDLSDYFEGYNSEQTIIALESAFNIIFNPLIIKDVLAPNPVLNDLDTILTWDSIEAQITDETIFALVNVHDTYSVMTLEELQQAFETSFTTIVNKLTEDVTGDHFNSDVATIYSEMSTFNKINVHSYLYDERANILRVYITFSMY